MKVKIKKHKQKKLDKDHHKKKSDKKKSKKDEDEHNPLDVIADLLDEYEEGLSPRSIDDFEM